MTTGVSDRDLNQETNDETGSLLYLERDLVSTLVRPHTKTVKTSERPP